MLKGLDPDQDRLKAWKGLMSNLRRKLMLKERMHSFLSYVQKTCVSNNLH